MSDTIKDLLDKQKQFKEKTGYDLKLINEDGTLTEQGCFMLMVMGINLAISGFEIIYKALQP